MKRSLVAVVALAASLATAADFDVRAYGAKGDGSTKDTAAIQRAIDECGAKGGGRVVLDGGTFLTAPITLKGGVELHIEANARLLGSPDLADYPNRTDTRHADVSLMPRQRNASLIYAEECENIAISGRGMIDANGRMFVREKTAPDWTGYPFERTVPNTNSLPRVVFFSGVRGVSVTEITLTGLPAGWGFWIHDCDYVQFSRVKVLSDMRFPNNDGIHINCSRDVTISDCIVEAGDDAIIVRANSLSLKENKPCERVTVANCTLKSWMSGIRLGWVNDGVIRDCVFSNIVMGEATKGICLQMGNWTKNDHGREATLIENITFSNIIMDYVYTHPLLMCVTEDDPKTTVAAIRDIRFSNVHARSLEKPYLVGRSTAPFSNFRFDNCTFTQIPDSQFPIRLDRHGGSAWNRKGDVAPKNCTGFVYDDVTARSWPEIEKAR